MKPVVITDVGPRDGFQSIQDFIPTALKIQVIEGLISAGVKHVMLTSFMSPKAIPQLRDCKEVCAAVLPKHPEIDLFALTANTRGVTDAWEAGLRKVAFVISVTESHNRANLNRSVDESFQDLAGIRAAFPDLHICLDVATAFGCPFEGLTPLAAVLAYIRRGVDLGITEFNLCDTVGVATPDQVKATLEAVRAAHSGLTLDVHIHDTRNMGIVNTLTAIQCGADSVQTSIGGLGGCPFAPGASGNTATEDLVYMLNRMGYHTGIDFEQLLAVAKLCKANIDGNYSSHHLNITKQCPM